MTTVLVFGDSNSHGTRPLQKLGQFERYPRGTPWPDAMAQALGQDVHVVTEGLPARTTVHDDVVEGGMRNGLTVLPALLHSHRPIDVLVVMLGTNDLKPRFGVTSWEIARSVERLILTARVEAVHRRELIICPAPIRAAGVLMDVFEGAEARQRGMADHMRAAADRLGCGFLNAGDHVTVSELDGVHWSEDTHRNFGPVVAAKVKELLA